MKRLQILGLLLLTGCVGVAGAQVAGITPILTENELVCKIPKAAEPRLVELCQDLYERDGIAPADCTYELLRRVMSQYSAEMGLTKAHEARRAKRLAREREFNTNFPKPMSRACGDGTLQREFNEQCDPPDGGVTCDERCQKV